MSSKYEPLPDEPLEEASVTVNRRRSKRTSSRRKRGSKGKAALLLGVLVLIVVLVVIAILLPIVMTSPVSRSASAAPAGAAAPVAANQMVSPTGETLPSNGGAGASPAVGPNSNAGDVYCYRGSNGQLFPGGLRKTGATRTTEGVARSEVESCSSRNRMYLTTARLELCSDPCLTPVWLAATQGLVAAPVWTEDFVCQGDRAFINTKTAQFSFYLKYSRNERETLITECDSDKGWFVADRELRACTAAEKEACNQQDLARVTPRGQPLIFEVGTPGQVIRKGPVCRPAGPAMQATGTTRNRFVWWRLSHVDEAEVKPCNNANAVSEWIDVKTFVLCTDAVKASCSAGEAQAVLATTTGTAAATTTVAPTPSP